jgi:hypothetical protein
VSDRPELSRRDLCVVSAWPTGGMREGAKRGQLSTNQGAVWNCKQESGVRATGPLLGATGP